MTRTTTIDTRIRMGDWSEVAENASLKPIDNPRLHQWRLSRLRGELKRHDAAMCLLVSPISLRYAVNYRDYLIFQSHMPQAYVFLAQEGPTVIHSAVGGSSWSDETRPGYPISFFEGATSLSEYASRLAKQVVEFLHEVGSDNRRVAVEYINPSITQALEREGLEVIDGVLISERARIIKSPDEIQCIRRAIAVAEHGLHEVRNHVSAGVSELQLWGLLNYTNISNDGDWHEGRMLASGPRINPWLQEASPRKIKAGDLVGLDTDMVGPRGYFADISRTFHCGPSAPNKRQRELYQLALAEIEYNLTLIKPGVTLRQFQERAYLPEEEFHKNAYPCTIHGVGMCDEYPQIKPRFRGPNPYDGVIEENMVLCVESYMGAEGERDGVKLEQQILVTKDGHEIMSTFPLEDALLTA